MRKCKGIKRFNRSTNTRKYRKVFNVFMEGQKTEPIYFGILKQQCNNVSILLHSSTTRTDPPQILSRAKKHIRKNKLLSNEEIWIVIDIDNRKKDKFTQLYQYQKENKKFGFAVSNPSFEYWLLLHFENGDNIKNLNNCIVRLKRYLPGYEKNNLGINKIDNALLKKGIENGKKKYKQCDDWHTDNYSTVYLLVEKFLIEEKII